MSGSFRTKFLHPDSSTQNTQVYRFLKSSSSILKVGVFDTGGDGWTGGITYLRNLARAVKTNAPDKAQLFLIRRNQQEKASNDPVAGFFDGVVGVNSFGGLDRPVLELIRKAVAVLARGDVLNARRYEKTLGKEGIEVVFGNGLTNKFRLPSVGWFPDFQHVDLPEFFSQEEITARDIKVKWMARNCTLMVFSSKHAKMRFLKMYPFHEAKTRVLSFVAHLPSGVLNTNPAYLMQKHGIPEKFIYLPNQLWKHKNHLTAFRAVKILADCKEEIRLVCSGNLSDPRNPGYKEEVFEFLRESGLSSNVFHLGMVDFDDVYALIRQSCCVLNPSLYEGWSTTVEETKTIGKPMILSDLEVHREQNPPETIFFEPKSAGMLAEAMLRVWRLYPPGPNREMEAIAANDYPNRSKLFAESFVEICRSAAVKKGT